MDHYAQILAAKHFVLMIKSCEGEIYTSDNPFIMHNEHEFGPYGNIGLAVPYVQIYYPISSELVLAIFCHMTLEQMEKELNDADKTLKREKAKTFLNPHGILSIQLEQFRSAAEQIEQARADFRMLIDHHVAPIRKENLPFLNSLQLQWCSRYIAARRGPFSFAEKAIRENPRWRDPPRIRVD